MILTTKQAHQIATKRKTTHRVTNTTGWPTGRTIAIQPGPNQPPTCHIRTTSHTTQQLADITRAQAATEGFHGIRGQANHRRHWLTTHDTAWTQAHQGTTNDTGLTDEHITSRYHQHWGHITVTVLTLELTEPPDLWMAPGAGTTTNRTRSIDPDATYCPPNPQYVKQAAEQAHQQRESFRRDLETQRKHLNAQRGRDRRNTT